jgi:protein lin-28
MSRIQGTVKWFSNQKGFGFISPTSEDSPYKEDIFVHQSAVESDGFRSLVRCFYVILVLSIFLASTHPHHDSVSFRQSEGWTVEFEAGKDENGKLRALKVTAPGGGPCTGPRIRRIRNKKSTNKTSEENGKKPREPRKKTPPEENDQKKPGEPRKKTPPWHDVLQEDVKNSLREKAVRTKTGTVDIAFEEQRIKLGTGGYSAMARGDGVLAEGTFTATENGNVSFSWDKAVVFEGGEWKSCGTDGLLANVDLMNPAVGHVSVDETPETLWGEGKTDPKDALVANGFQMRHVVLTRGNSKRGRD